MLSENFLHRLDGLSLNLEGRVQGGAGGQRKSRDPGVSSEFSDYREYTPGDDLRRLDWTVFARTGRLYLKQFMDDQDSRVMLLLDGSRSMQAKAELLKDAAMALGYLALSGGDRLQAAWLSERTECSRTMTARRDAPVLAAFLNAGVMDGTGDLLTGLRACPMHQRGLCLLLTDGYGDQTVPECLDFLRAHRQSVVLVQILSREEMTPELEGALELRDAEKQERTPLVVQEDVLRQYRKARDHFLAQTREACMKRGVRYVPLLGEENLEKSLLPHLQRAQVISGV